LFVVGYVPFSVTVGAKGEGRVVQALPLSSERASGVILEMSEELEITADEAAPLVLLIDDADELRVLISEFLGAHGFRVATAKNGFEGLRAAVESRPNIILMDLVMPGMDGLETTRLLKRQAVTAHVPIIAFTGETLLPELSRFRAKGFAELITKPHDPQELLTTLRRLMIQ
jgi:CheY-like chemotaxis protein